MADQFRPCSRRPVEETAAGEGQQGACAHGLEPQAESALNPRTRLSAPEADTVGVGGPREVGMGAWPPPLPTQAAWARHGLQEPRGAGRCSPWVHPCQGHRKGFWGEGLRSGAQTPPRLPPRLAPLAVVT